MSWKSAVFPNNYNSHSLCCFVEVEVGEKRPPPHKGPQRSWKSQLRCSREETNEELLSHSLNHPPPGKGDKSRSYAVKASAVVIVDDVRTTSRARQEHKYQCCLLSSLHSRSDGHIFGDLISGRKWGGGITWSIHVWFPADGQSTEKTVSLAFNHWSDGCWCYWVLGARLVQFYQLSSLPY